MRGPRRITQHPSLPSWILKRRRSDGHAVLRHRTTAEPQTNQAPDSSDKTGRSSEKVMPAVDVTQSRTCAEPHSKPQIQHADVATE